MTLTRGDEYIFVVTQPGSQRQWHETEHLRGEVAFSAAQIVAALQQRVDERNFVVTFGENMLGGVLVFVIAEPKVKPRICRDGLSSPGLLVDFSA
ncbi:hypothetical protein [Mycobacterium botniense]|uniref:hypothetical protein n=1 Tax=Mycobacterium botniense TaxID=84962 RepID=UPI0013D74DE4|nr:hypothetical protein [Mycobacterium botniense]